MRAEPLGYRREPLRKLIGSHDPRSPIQFSESLSGSGAEILEAACRMGLEGIVSKKLRSTYRSGRSTAWLKAKCYAEEEFVVIGAEYQPGRPALALLAREDAHGLHYAGSAFLTLAGEERDAFWSAIEQHARPKPTIAMPRRKATTWAEPVLRVRAQYLKGSEKLRHATVRELLT